LSINKPKGKKLANYSYNSEKTLKHKIISIINKNLSVELLLLPFYHNNGSQDKTI